MTSRLAWVVRLVPAFATWVTVAVGADANPAETASAGVLKADANTSLPVISEMLLTGIAAIGKAKFIYLTHTSGKASMELMVGEGAPQEQPGGVEVLKVCDEGPPASWRVLVRNQGKEWWLSFAPASMVPSGSGLATGVPAAVAAPVVVSSQAGQPAAVAQPQVLPPVIKAAPSRPATFSSDPSKDTPDQRRQRRNNFPLPPGL